MDYTYTENDIYNLEALGISIEDFERACSYLLEVAQEWISEIILYFRRLVETTTPAIKDLAKWCEELFDKEMLDIEYKPRLIYKPVVKLGNYENPKLTYRYFHRDRFRERR